ncbi:hypothetical protein HK101_006125, partial [Irineochytrium annulatum]
MFLVVAPVVWSRFPGYLEQIDRSVLADLNTNPTGDGPTPWSPAWRLALYLRSVRILAITTWPPVKPAHLLPWLQRLDTVEFWGAFNVLEEDDAKVGMQGWVNAVLDLLRRDEGPRDIFIQGEIRKKDVAEMLSFDSLTTVRLAFREASDYTAILRHDVMRLEAPPKFINEYAKRNGAALRSLVIREKGLRIKAPLQPLTWTVPLLSGIDVLHNEVDTYLLEILAVARTTLKTITLVSEQLSDTDVEAMAALPCLSELTLSIQTQIPNLGPLAVLKNIRILKLAVTEVQGNLDSETAALEEVLRSTTTLRELHLTWQARLRLRLQNLVSVHLRAKEVVIEDWAEMKAGGWPALMCISLYHCRLLAPEGTHGPVDLI